MIHCIEQMIPHIYTLFTPIVPVIKYKNNNNNVRFSDENDIHIIPPRPNYIDR